MSAERQLRRRQGPDSSRDQNVPHLAVLLEERPGGGGRLHAGIARHGKGPTMCDLRDPIYPSVLLECPEFELAAKDPNMALYRTDGYRHRCTEAWLELNRGCLTCLNTLYAISKEHGWTEPKGLKS